MPLKYLFLYFLLSSMNILSRANPHRHRQHLAIHWNSSNQIFHSLRFLTVHLGDLIDFICPHYDSNAYKAEPIEYNTLYLVDENDYHHCNTMDYHPLLKCNKPFGAHAFIYTLSISKYLPYPNLPEFDEGQVYYFISTSAGQLSHIDQRSAGLCERKNMKLVLNVQRYSRSLSDEHHRKPIPIIAKRTNATFLDLNQRLFSFSSLSSTATSRNLSLLLVLFVFCLLEKLKT